VPFLLVTAPMCLAHAALGQMLGAASGTIVNIASVAGYTPRGTYGASKAWVLSFSRWANLTYRTRGVGVTAVAPGFVHTEFHDRMNVSKDGVPAFLWLDAATLVRLALRDVTKGRAVSIPTLRYKLVVTLSGLLPKQIVAIGALRGR
jgi:short-subunit dehydrogenase